jgi:hypothetical protein
MDEVAKATGFIPVVLEQVPARLPAFQEVPRRLLSLRHTRMAMTADADDGRPGD